MGFLRLVFTAITQVSGSSQARPLIRLIPTVLTGISKSLRLHYLVLQGHGTLFKFSRQAFGEHQIKAPNKHLPSMDNLALIRAIHMRATTLMNRNTGAEIALERRLRMLTKATGLTTVLILMSCINHQVRTFSMFPCTNSVGVGVGVLPDLEQHGQIGR